MNNNKIIWIGIQESELQNTNHFFYGSITIFGSGKNGNYSFEKKYNLRFNYNYDNYLWTQFVNDVARHLIFEEPSVHFMLYYPMDITLYDTIIQDRIIAINDSKILDLLDNKLKCRVWLSNEIPLLPQQICDGEYLIQNLNSLCSSGNLKVIQEEYSCGGTGTWLLSLNNYERIRERININKKYSITPYIENNIPVNIHLVIYKDTILPLAPSVQMIILNSDSFKYSGSDYIAYSFLPSSIKTKLLNYARIIGEKLRQLGYLGVCGVDFIATQEEVYFMEINPRFQSSSFLLNKAFEENQRRVSLQQLHFDAFSGNSCDFSLQMIPVNLSFFKFTFSKDNYRKMEYLSKHLKTDSSVTYIDDDLSKDVVTEEDTYLFKLVFLNNICAISPDFRLIINHNLLQYRLLAKSDLIEKHMQELKIMLLTHGVTISPAALRYLNSTGGINHKEFDALDLCVNNKYYINVPYNCNLTNLSLFEIDKKGSDLYLCYCDTALAKVTIRKEDPISNKHTTSGLLYSDIAYLGYDRLRIFHRLGCSFKDASLGCKFCDIENIPNRLSYNDIKEIITAYEPNESIRHYLIGGGSREVFDDFDFICQIAKYINETTAKPIYLMSLPPQNDKILTKLKESGITEVAFNMEIFDRTIAKSIMPGKGSITIAQYERAFIQAVALWGNQGNVRSIFIVGLEPKHSLLEGIKYVCKLGVSPILSLFRPSNELEHLLPFSDEDILDIVTETQKICNTYGIPLGPQCKCCEDNTLKITL